MTEGWVCEALGDILRAEAGEEIVEGTAVELLQVDEDADADVELAILVLGIGRGVDIAAAALQHDTQLGPREVAAQAHSPQVVTEAAVDLEFVHQQYLLSPITNFFCFSI